MSLSFEGKVVVVTGASGGIGKALSHMFASRGAKLLLNDLGCDVNGKGASKEALDNLVNSLRGSNPNIHVNYDSVQQGEKIIEHALRVFGRVDVLVNNAGIIKDSSFGKVKEDQFRKLIDVNLTGSYKCCRAVWPHMLKQGYGRIINTTSAVGLYGNFGQAGYTTAKLGLHGLTRSLAAEGQSRNVLVNSIAPIAASRMTDTIFPPDMQAILSPNHVAALVGLLCHQSNKVNGQVFEVTGGFVARVRWQQNKGLQGKELTPEAIRDNIKQLNDFDGKGNAAYPEDISLQDRIGLYAKL